MVKNGVKNLLLGCLLGSSIGGINAFGDDVTDTVEEAMEAYKKGEYKKASEDLSYALEVINQKKGKNLRAYLPEPLSGWTADDAESQTVGTAMFGGGTMINRSYHKGNASVKIEMIMDSPMLQGVAMMFSNPMIATSDGGELVRIKREKAIVKYKTKDKSGEITMVVANRIMITVKGYDISKDDLMAYAEAIDINKLKELQ